MLWTQYTDSSYYEVMFEKIPEFSDVAFPVMLTLIVFAVYRVRLRRDRRENNEGDGE